MGCMAIPPRWEIAPPGNEIGRRHKPRAVIEKDQSLTADMHQHVHAASTVNICEGCAPPAKCHSTNLATILPELMALFGMAA
jgi:hypothetical protein